MAVDAPGRTPVTIGTTTYFLATDPDHGQALWKSDGTAAGTGLVKDFVPGPGSATVPTYLAGVGDRLLAVAPDASGTYRLWASDGTAVATTVLAPDAPPLIGTAPVVWRGLSYYLTSTGPPGRVALWSTDGTPLGTQQVAVLAGSSASGETYRLAAADAGVFVVGSR